MNLGKYIAIFIVMTVIFVLGLTPLEMPITNGLLGAPRAYATGVCPDYKKDQSTTLLSLGIPVWHKYLDHEEQSAKKGTSETTICKVKLYNTTSAEIESDPNKAGLDLSKNITAIGLAFIEILMRILFYLAIIWGIWGGYEIIVSSGNPQGMKNGINRIKNAAIGLVIGILSTPIVAFIAKKMI